MPRVHMAVSNGALRCAVQERDWLPLTAGLRHLQLPDVFVPPAEQVRAWCAAAGADLGTPDILDSEDDLTKRALRLKAAAALEVDVQASVCGEGSMMLGWTNGVAASSLARQLLVPADGAPQLLDGVVLSAFPVHRLAHEMLHHVPSGGPTPLGLQPVALAPPHARDLVLQMRAGDPARIAAAAHRAGFATPPPLVEALATGLIGEASVTIEGVRGAARFRFVLCEAGWIEIHARSDGRLQHTPYDADAMLDLFRRELAAQLAAAA